MDKTNIIREGCGYFNEIGKSGGITPPLTNKLKQRKEAAPILASLEYTERDSLVNCLFLLTDTKNRQFFSSTVFVDGF